MCPTAVVLQSDADSKAVAAVEGAAALPASHQKDACQQDCANSEPDPTTAMLENLPRAASYTTAVMDHSTSADNSRVPEPAAHQPAAEDRFTSGIPNTNTAGNQQGPINSDSTTAESCTPGGNAVTADDRPSAGSYRRVAWAPVQNPFPAAGAGSAPAPPASSAAAAAAAAAALPPPPATISAAAAAVAPLPMSAETEEKYGEHFGFSQNKPGQHEAEFEQRQNLQEVLGSSQQLNRSTAGEEAELTQGDCLWTSNDAIQCTACMCTCCHCVVTDDIVHRSFRCSTCSCIFDMD